MTTVPAAQIIYTRLERADSPRRQDGFQTAFYSHDVLTRQLLEEVETLFLFPPSSVQHKLVFCPVGRRQLLLAHLIRVCEVDQVGRQGNFMAHGLVFSEDDFVRLGGNPITTARNFRFCRTLREARQRGDVKTGHVPVARLTASDSPASPLDLLLRWTPRNLKNLLLLATSVEDLRRAGSLVAFIGESESVCDLLEMVFAALPLRLRCRLSFDSHAERSTMSLWAQGFLAAPNRPRLLTVDVAACLAEPFHSDLPLTSYAVWLSRRLDEHGVEGALAVQEPAWSLCELIDHGVWTMSLPPNAVDENIAGEVWTPAAANARSRLLQTLEQAVGRRLARRAVNWFLENVSVTDRFAAMIAVCDRALATGLHATYCQLSTPPAPEEQHDLTRFLQRKPDPRLSVWLAVWQNAGTRLRDLLSSLSGEEYARLVRDLGVLNELDPLRLYVPGRGREFAKGITLRGRVQAELTQIVRCLVSDGQADALVWLIPLLQSQPTSQLLRVKKLLPKKATETTIKFTAALDAAIGSSDGAKLPIWKRMFHGEFGKRR